MYQTQGTTDWDFTCKDCGYRGHVKCIDVVDWVPKPFGEGTTRMETQQDFECPECGSSNVDDEV